MTKVAILGLGAMGARMARRVLDAGHDVAVYNRTAERARPLVELGARLGATPAAAADGADIVISVVTDDAAARAVWLHPEHGAVRSLRADAVAVESSTVTPAWVDELRAAIDDVGAELLDAPVAGSRPQAEAGQLIYLVGGSADALDRVRPVLTTMGQAVHHVGEIGAGTVMKLAVNAIFGIQVAALAEMLGMVTRAGIDMERAVGILGAMPITSPALKGVGGLIAAGKYAPMFPIDLVEKDFRYIEACARSVEAQVPTAAAVWAVYDQARSAGFGADNIAGVAQLFVRS